MYCLCSLSELTALLLVVESHVVHDGVEIRPRGAVLQLDVAFWEAGNIAVLLPLDSDALAPGRPLAEVFAGG